MKFVGERMKMIVEPAGVMGLAGVRKMAQTGQMKDKARVGIIICGGNIDMISYCKYVSEGL